jgi:arylsulfatase A-like enzyme
MRSDFHLKGLILLRILLSAWAMIAAMATAGAATAGPAPHNVILFVADGLRSSVVTPETAPALAALRREGVDFRNSHSIFPTITTPNASTLATGHLLGDTGDFGNSIYTVAPTPSAAGSFMPPLENDAVLGDLNARYGGNYLNETSVLAAAHAKGYSTAAIGKLGPVAIQSVTAREGLASIIIDDGTGSPSGIVLAPEVTAAIQSAGLAPLAPSRGTNGAAGSATTPGTLVANIDQQRWFLDVATKVLLPRFKAAGKPFVLVYWSRDPDGTQHNQGDSLGALVPGINGPTSMAAIRNADLNLAALRQAVADLGLADTTDILVTADHGFSTVSKQSHTSPAAAVAYPDVPKGQLPVGFLAIDLAAALDLRLFEPSGELHAIDWKQGRHPAFGAALLGDDPKEPEVVVAANGGADLIYLPKGDAKATARKVVRALLAQDYVGAVFVNDDLGPVPGALPMSAVGLIGSARTPQPAIVVSFRSESTGCANPELCAAEVADTNLQQGQGIHGTFSRADTHNFMAAIGPDFKAGFVDPAPTSNADVSRTMARLLRLDIAPKGKLAGRVLKEALRGGKPVRVTRRTVAAKPDDAGLATILRTQSAAGVTYFDVAGIPGRTVGLAPQGPHSAGAN